MAFIVYGSTRCSLCGNLILKDQDIVAFGSFITNEVDPLLKFSDASFHEECFRGDPLAGAVERRWQIYEKQGPPAQQRCQVCSQKITDPDDYFAFGHLTDDSSHPLHRFNYAVFHRSHLPDWPDLSAVCELASAHMKSGAWKGRGMQWIVDTLTDAVAK